MSMTVKDMTEQLEALKQENREKEKALRKEIAKQKRKENEALTLNVGKLARSKFPNLTTLEEFEKLFSKLTVEEKKVSVFEQIRNVNLNNNNPNNL